MEDEEKQIRYELGKSFLRIVKGCQYIGPLMYDNIDSFVELSRDNTSVLTVELYLFDSDAGNYDFWDKVGQVVANLTELRMLSIHFVDDDDDDDEYEVRRPDWEILTRILRNLRRKVLLSSATGEDDAEVEEIRALARTVRGHPMISAFSSEMEFSFANVGPWCSALATLPSLERITLGLQEPETEDQRDLVNLMPLTELLRAPALRFVRFDTFYFTNVLCHATANALEEGSSIVGISFDDECSFPDGGRAIIANALKRNTSVTYVEFGDFDEPLCNTLAAVLLSNSTLQNLMLDAATSASGKWLSSIFLSLGMNATLKSLSVCIFDKFGDELCTAIRNGLARNSTLDKLSLYDMVPSDDDGAVSARDALSFLRTNSTLKSLTVTFVPAQNESYVSAFQVEALKMTMDNPFLESLTIANGSQIKFEELVALLSALHRDITLKTLSLQSGFPQVSHESLYLNDDKVNQLVSILKKNYGLEHLLPGIRCADDRNVKAIFRLNSAGRRYLIEDGSSISNGVGVLSAVSDDINCVFFHLLENPSLCER
jgi:hypothetical protein